MSDNDFQRVVVTDIRMPFWSMVIFMVKWAVAAIPALIILFLLLMAFFAIFSSAFAGLIHTLLGA